ncbi:response regulator transcription factor [Paenibacillus puerhi]|uniref:response regulator transcription factor n=1 Tax=Paenibacillus puerhi TaxID=2692622 RepID=UPI00135977D4|nr:response regulator transcription factor [Paenibacillus puerhi]
MRDKIILVDDQEEIRTLLIPFLTQHGFEVIGSSYGEPADLIGLIRTHAPGLIVLDVRRPELSGLEVCAGIRRFSDTPLLFMGPDADEQLRITALGAGGDAYIAKPFSLELLLAQVKAQLRRYRREFPVHQRHLLQFPDLEIDLFSRSVRAYGQPAVLSAKEYQLLVILAKHPNRVFHTQELYDRIWPEHRLGDLRTVMVHIYNLRKKIERQPRKPQYIHTIRGVGYKFNAVVPQSSATLSSL